MGRLVLIFLFSIRAYCFAADDTNALAAGDWSKPVGDVLGYTLRGRLLLCDSPKDRTTAVYLELQECSKGWGGCLDVYCNMKPTVALGGNPDAQGRERVEKAAATWELRDRAGKLVPETPTGFG